MICGDQSAGNRGIITLGGVRLPRLHQLHLHPQIGMKSYELDHFQKENHIKILIDIGYGCYMYLLNNEVLQVINVNNATHLSI